MTPAHIAMYWNSLFALIILFAVELTYEFSSLVTWKIPAGVPEGIITGNKTGELTNIENDAAFIESPACTYILCVMTAGVDSGTAIGNINELSSAVYSLLNQDLEGEEP